MLVCVEEEEKKDRKQNDTPSILRCCVPGIQGCPLPTTLHGGRKEEGNKRSDQLAKAAEVAIGFARKEFIAFEQGKTEAALF
jgi:hypothetical protein